MITLTFTKETTEEDWEDHMLHSGAHVYPWWVSFEEFSDGDIALHYRDPDSETYYNDRPKVHWTTLQKLADTASRMAEDYPMVAEALINEDFDADAADLVLQYDAFGEVVYG